MPLGWIPEKITGRFSLVSIDNTSGFLEWRVES
jgi:hypothetical protein